MMGNTHVLSGMFAGAVSMPVIDRLPGVQLTGLADMGGWVLVAGGAALLPDLDHPKATATRLWGPLLWPLHKAVRWAGRGHRGGSHDIIVAPLVFGGLAWLAALHPLSVVVMLAMVAGVAARGVGLVIPQVRRFSRTVVRALAVAALAVVGLLAYTLAGGAVFGVVLDAAWVTAITTWMQGLSWLPWAIGLGVVLHIAGDAVTKTGVPVPFTWIDGRATTNAGVLRTGRWYERWLIAPGLLLATGIVLGLQPDPNPFDHLTNTITTARQQRGEPS